MATKIQEPGVFEKHGDAPAITNDQASQLLIVDYLRGVSALLVLVFHWTICVDGFVQGIALQVCKTLNAGVFIFFAISGFIMPFSLRRANYGYLNAGRFFAKRALRLDPTYFVAILFCLITGWLATLHSSYRGAPFKLDYAHIAMHFLYLCPFFGRDWVAGGGVMWTLGIEAQYYVLLAVCFPLFINKKNWFSSTVIVALAFFAFADPMMKYRFILPYAPFFCLGVIAFRYHCNLISIWGFLFSTSVVGVIAFITFPLHEALSGILGAICIVLVKHPPKIWFLLFLGDISYSLYLFHLPIAIKSVNFLSRYDFARQWNWLIVIMGCVVCISLATIVHRLVELPSKRWAARIRY